MAILQHEEVSHLNFAFNQDRFLTFKRVDFDYVWALAKGLADSVLFLSVVHQAGVEPFLVNLHADLPVVDISG